LKKDKGAKVKGLLQKINFIETDMELHKQILVSISPDDKAQMESIIKKIADLKQQINELRSKIKTIDENEYNKIIAIEKAAMTFRKISRDRKYVQVNTLNESGQCFITLNDGTRIDCLVAAKEENGNWTILTLEGKTREYPGGLVK
jgi:vacuolar-type H+-ATPase subunit I/STV1